MNFAHLCVTILSLGVTCKLRVAAYSKAFDIIQDSLAELEKKSYEDEHSWLHSRLKRAIVLFAPHITFANKIGQKPHKRASYGDSCNLTWYKNNVLPVYEAAEKEDDDQYGTLINATATRLIETLTGLLSSPDNTDGAVGSWLQTGCVGWYPMNCTTVGGTGAPVCRCLNSTKADTPTRHHPHYMHEGGRCRVIPGAFCRYHPQYKSGSKCSRGGVCVNYTCTLVAISAELPSANIFSNNRFFHLLLPCIIMLTKKLYE